MQPSFACLIEANSATKSVISILIYMELSYLPSQRLFRPDFEPVVSWLMESACQISFQERTAEASRNECALGCSQDLWLGERT